MKGDWKPRKPFFAFELNLFLQVGDFLRNCSEALSHSSRCLRQSLTLKDGTDKRHQSPVHSNVGSIIVAKVTNSAEVPPPELYFTTAVKK